jgi:hypothetical protein
MSFALFPYLQAIAILFFLWQYHVIIKFEEEFLAGKYGDQYSDYEKNVKSIVPRLSPYKNPDVLQPPFNLKAGLKSEKRSLQAFLIAASAILIIWLIKNVIR